MSEFCTIGGRILYKTEGGYVKDFYGRFLYIYDNYEVREWGSRFIIYRFDGNNIKDFYGRILYSFDGHYFRDFYGKILYVYEHNNIAKFASIPEYSIRGSASNREVAMYIILFVIQG